jgi:putative polyketide hydroxylase
MLEEKVPVLVVGSGLAGLSCAVFLALHGVRALVIDRHPGTSTLPKARGQNPVTMEALRVAGLADAIHAACPPGRPGVTSRVSESLAGQVFMDHVARRPDFSRFSPETPGLASQARAEEALLARARALGVEVRFGTECLSVEETADSVQAELADVGTGRQMRVNASYLVAADGIRGSIAAQVGLGHEGMGLLKSVTAVRFDADLSRWSGDKAMTIHYVKNAALPDGSGVLVSTDHPRQWVGNFSADPARSLEETARLIRLLVGVPELEFTITGDTTYHYSHRIAERLSTRRVFLTGDAAHVMPPTGGQGGNTALQDGYYLGWKMALVLRGLAGPALLATHDPERRTYARIVCDWQAANLADRRDMKGLAARIGEPIDHATMMFGYICPEGAFVPDGAPRPAADHPFENPAEPTGLPGARVPYARLDAADGPVCTRRGLGPWFALYTESPDEGRDAAATAADLGLDLRVHVVGSTAPLRAEGSASVLVRPDGVVAWRGDASADLARAWRQVLCH